MMYGNAFNWEQVKPRLVKALKKQYALHPVHKIRTPERATFLWSALDALADKLSLLLKDLKRVYDHLTSQQKKRESSSKNKQ